MDRNAVVYPASHLGPMPRTEAELLREPWAFGPWCLVIEEVRLFPRQDWGCSGMLGWWPVDKRDPGVVGGLDGLVPEHGQRWSAVTLKQPYASAVAIGPKRVENRQQQRHIPSGGIWVGLHAGMSAYPDADDLINRWRALPTTAPRRDPHWPGCPDLSRMPRGFMLGAMKLVACLRYPEGSPQPTLFGSRS